MIDFMTEMAKKNEAFDFHDKMSNIAFEMSNFFFLFFSFLSCWFGCFFFSFFLSKQKKVGHSALGEKSDFLKQHAPELRHAFDIVLNKGFLGEKLEQDPEYFEADQVLTRFAKTVFQRYEEQQKEKTALAQNSNHPQHGQGGDISKCPFHQAMQEGGGKGVESILFPNSVKPSPPATAQSDVSKEQPSAIDIIMGKYEDGTPYFNERQRHSQLSTFMFAGHETTANTCSFMVLELARNPAVQAKLRDDINKTLTKMEKEKGPNFQMEFTDLFKFQYLTLVINETLRLWPIVALGTTRILDKGMMIGEYLVEKGTTVNFPHYLVHRDPDYWEKPTEFIPERKWNHEAFLPFTRAPRDCLGRNLAMLEIRSFIIGIIRNFEIELMDPKTPIEGFEAGTLRPLGGAWIKVKKI